jgi:hypothetical protein
MKQLPELPCMSCFTKVLKQGDMRVFAASAAFYQSVGKFAGDEQLNF